MGIPIITPRYEAIVTVSVIAADPYNAPPDATRPNNPAQIPNAIGVIQKPYIILFIALTIWLTGGRALLSEGTQSRAKRRFGPSG